MKKTLIHFIGCLTFIFFSSSAVADVLLIANNSVKETSIPSEKIQLIFLGKTKKWKDGKKIRLAVLRLTERDLRVKGVPPVRHENVGRRGQQVVADSQGSRGHFCCCS